MDDSSAQELIECEKIDPVESPKIIAKYISDIVQKKLEDIASVSQRDNAQQDQIAFANEIVQQITKAAETYHVEGQGENLIIRPEAEQLFSVVERENSLLSLQEGKSAKLDRLETSVASSSLIRSGSSLFPFRHFSPGNFRR